MFLKSKTVILVTHQLHFLSKSNKILVLDQGRGQEFEDLDTIFNSGSNFASIIKLSKPANEPKSSNKELSNEEHPENIQRRSNSTTISLRRVSESLRKMSTRSAVSIMSELHIQSPEDLTLSAPAKEEQNSGAVSGKTYWTYFEAGSGLLFAFGTLLVNIISQAFYSITDVYLAHWTNGLSTVKDFKFSETMNETILMADNSVSIWNIVPPNDVGSNILIYTVLMIALFATTILRAVLYFQMSYRASISLHNSIFNKILRSPMQLFEENPVGKFLTI